VLICLQPQNRGTLLLGLAAVELLCLTKTIGQLQHAGRLPMHFGYAGMHAWYGTTHEQLATKAPISGKCRDIVGHRRASLQGWQAAASLCRSAWPDQPVGCACSTSRVCCRSHGLVSSLLLATLQTCTPKGTVQDFYQGHADIVRSSSTCV